MPEPRTPPRLTKADRCDRCGAQAMVTVVLHSGRDLIFCRHHYREHFWPLFRASAFTRDESEAILGRR